MELQEEKTFGTPEMKDESLLQAAPRRALAMPRAPNAPIKTQNAALLMPAASRALETWRASSAQNGAEKQPQGLMS